MISDRLYDFAFQFKKTKLWKKLYDTQLFAMKHADGTIGYCCVMGMMGEHLALAVYPGDEGMDSYRLMGKDRSKMNDLEVQETALSQNCLMLSFENKDELRPKELEEVRAYCAARQLVLRGRKAYPQFQRFRPHYYPWYVEDEKDQAHLLEALEACLDVSAKLDDAVAEDLGFTEGAPFNHNIPLLQKKDGGFAWSTIELPEPQSVVYPSPEACDDIALAKLAKTKKRGGEWACDVFMHVNPMSNEKGESGTVDEPKNAPFYPYLLLIVNNKSGVVMNVQLSDNPEDYVEKFTRAILEVAQNNGKPSRILVQNERTRALFYKLSTQLGSELVMKERIPKLEEAEQSFLEQFEGDELNTEDEMAQLMETLRDSAALAKMPDEMLMQLSQIVQVGVLPDDIVGNVDRECKKRGLR